MAKNITLSDSGLGARTFGVPIGLVHEIVRVPEITAVPESPSYVEGIINLRGKIISIIDLRKRFGEKEIQPHRTNRILVTEVEGKMVGLIVDAASEVMKIPKAMLKRPQMYLKKAKSGT